MSICINLNKELAIKFLINVALCCILIETPITPHYRGQHRVLFFFVSLLVSIGNV